MSGSYYALNAKYNSLLSKVGAGGGGLTAVLTANDDAGGLDITNLNNINLTTINGLPPAGAENLQQTLTIGNSAGGLDITNLNQLSLQGTSTITDTTGDLVIQPPTNQTLQLGSNVYVDTQNNRVGINVPVPTEDLEIDGNIQMNTGSTSKIVFYDKPNAHEHGEIDAEGEGTNGGALKFQTKVDGGAVSEKLRITENGRIGLGGANYGTSGQVLTSNGSSAPTWNDAAGGGVPIYTTTERNALPTQPDFTTISNSTTGTLQMWNGSGWVDISESSLQTVVDFLVVAGGGATRYYTGAGGGAGGVRTSYGTTSGGGGAAEQSLKIPHGVSVEVEVGRGAFPYYTSGASANPDGVKGGNSRIQFTANGVVNLIQSTGGGHGAATAGNGQGGVVGQSGGSGGGANRTYGTGGAGITADLVLGTKGQGFRGGNNNGITNIVSAGGGGAGAVGQNSVNSTTGGSGGDGIICNILSASNAAIPVPTSTGTAPIGEVIGSDVWYGGGGGGVGGSYNTNTAGAGGKGGGGDGNGANFPGYTAGAWHTGGGGGGVDGASPSGGSGVVIIAYPSYASIQNLTTTSGNITATTYTEGSRKITAFTTTTNSAVGVPLGGICSFDIL
jgi:hypothetical protein